MSSLSSRNSLCFRPPSESINLMEDVIFPEQLDVRDCELEFDSFRSTGLAPECFLSIELVPEHFLSTELVPDCFLSIVLDWFLLSIAIRLPYLTPYQRMALDATGQFPTTATQAPLRVRSIRLPYHLLSRMRPLVVSRVPQRPTPPSRTRTRQSCPESVIYKADS